MNKSRLIDTYLDYYEKTQGLDPSWLDEIGKAYRQQGYLTQDQLYDLAFNNSTRSAHHVRDNPERRCRAVSKNVLAVEDDFSKVQLIVGLKGFQAPTASAALTAYDPERHAVVDTRVWASLERLNYVDGRKERFGPADYTTMIESIRELAEQTDFRVDRVGYALFAYDVDKRDGTLH